MSYAMQAPIALRASESARAAFIRRTYAHLAGAILAFTAIEALLFQINWAENITMAMLSSPIMWLFVLGAFIATGWVAEAWARSDVSQGLQYAGLALGVIVWAIIFVPLLYIAAHFSDPSVIPTAGILTLAIFGGLTASVFITGKDYSFLGPILSIGFFVALGLIIAAILFGFNLGLFFAFAMVALACGAILYDTSNVLHHYRTDQHVDASLSLFASVALLFWYILRILIALSGRE